MELVVMTKIRLLIDIKSAVARIVLIRRTVPNKMKMPRTTKTRLLTELVVMTKMRLLIDIKSAVARMVLIRRTVPNKMKMPRTTKTRLLTELVVMTKMRHQTKKIKMMTN
jgi:hypothetical protein